MHLIEIAPVTQIRPLRPVVAAVQTSSAVKTAELQTQFVDRSCSVGLIALPMTCNPDQKVLEVHVLLLRSTRYEDGLRALAAAALKSPDGTPFMKTSKKKAEQDKAQFFEDLSNARAAQLGAS